MRSRTTTLETTRTRYTSLLALILAACAGSSAAPPDGGTDAGPPSVRDEMERALRETLDGEACLCRHLEEVEGCLQLVAYRREHVACEAEVWARFFEGLPEVPPRLREAAEDWRRCLEAHECAPSSQDLCGERPAYVPFECDEPACDPALEATETDAEACRRG
ncbi:MAG: hypothetical protein H6722_34605 [Sandaracinus sp.]|nr:hypothetical protein [Sandaracinus sp.]